MAQVFVGLDIAKRHIAVAVQPTHERWRVANDESGMMVLAPRL